MARFLTNSVGDSRLTRESEYPAKKRNDALRRRSGWKPHPHSHQYRNATDAWKYGNARTRPQRDVGAGRPRLGPEAASPRGARSCGSQIEGVGHPAVVYLTRHGEELHCIGIGGYVAGLGH